LERRSAACYLVSVSVRHAVLSLGAVLVLGLGVYLFLEVRAPVETHVGAAEPARPAAAPLPVAARSADEPARSAPPPAAPPAPVAAPARAPSPPPPPVLAASDAGAPADVDLAGPKLEAVMAEANKAYDRGDFDDAKVIAGRLLARFPTNVRMLRIMVSASCIDGDTAAAQASYAKLPPADQVQMRVRCARYGVAFPEKL